MEAKFRCVIHGSFRKHWTEIKKAHEIFTAAGIEVLAPAMSEIVSAKDGFVILESDKDQDPRLIELIYLHNLKRLGHGGFSYFVNPEGYIGKSASYELGIAQISNVPCFFSASPADHPAYVHRNAVWAPELLAEYIKIKNELPKPRTIPDEEVIHKMWEDLMVPGSVVAVGGIIEFDGGKKEKEVLLVKTHKWGGRYSIVGGKVRRNERMEEALLREVKEETGLRGETGTHVCTFDQIKDSGYYKSGIQHIFIDKIVRVGSKKVRLNEEAQEYIWMPVKAALRDLPVEPNAREALQIYANLAG